MRTTDTSSFPLHVRKGFLQPLALDLATNGVKIDLNGLADKLAADQDATDSATRSRALHGILEADERDARILARVRRDLLDRAARHLGWYRTDQLGFSEKSCALVNQLTPLFSFHDRISGEFGAPEGAMHIDVEVETAPWRVFAHLSGDSALAEAVEAGDVYTYFAEKCGALEACETPRNARSLVKYGLFTDLFNGSRDHLDATIRRQRDPLQAREAIRNLRRIIPAAYAYVRNLDEYGIAPLSIQAAANRVAGRAHAEARRLVAESGLGQAALLFDQGSVIYRVPTENESAFRDLFKDAAVTADGVRSPIRVH